MSATILIVENHDAVRQALRDWLEVNLPQSHLIEATCQEEAIAQIQIESPQLVVMDINMPGVNGLEMTRNIKNSSPSTKIVVVSSNDDEIYRIKATESGASAYVSKRSMLTTLLPTIDALLY